MKEVRSDDLIEMFMNKQKSSSKLDIIPTSRQTSMNIPQQTTNYSQSSFANRPGYNNDPNNPVIQMLLSKIKEVESEINNSLINEDVIRARNLYNEMKKLFSQFPDNYYEIKTDLFSDLLSANFRLHQLEVHLNKLKRMDINRIMYEEKKKELLREKEEEIRLEKNKIESEISDIGTEMNKYSTEQINNNIILKPNQDDEVELLQKRARLDRIKHDNEINKLSPQKELDENIDVSKIMIVDSKKSNNKVLINEKKRNNHNDIKVINENQAKMLLKKLEKKKEDLIEKLYSKGIKKLYSQDELEASNYFKKILEINPEYRPALIRLEQLKKRKEEATSK